MKPMQLLAAFLLTGAPCFAVTITLDNPAQSGVPGTTLTFSGTVANTGQAIVDLNGIVVSLPGEFTTGDAPFFNGPATVDPMSTSVDFGLFTAMIDIPYTDFLGTTSGTLTLLGGIEGPGGYDPSVQNVIGTANFSVTTTPEPSSWALGTLAIGVAALLRGLMAVSKGHRS
jgi:hypothetical protein